MATNDNVEIVKKLFKACESKDFTTVKSLIQADYSLKDPMMELHSADEMIAMMKDCPSDMKVKNLEVMAVGDDKVVSTFESTMSESGAEPLRMCSIVTLKSGKIAKEEMFYDTAKIPQKFKDMMKNSSAGTKKAA